MPLDALLLTPLPSAGGVLRSVSQRAAPRAALAAALHGTDSGAVRRCSAVRDGARGA